MNKMKRVISIMLALFLLVANSFPVCAGETFTYELDNKGIITYEVTDGDIVITGYSDENAISGEINIPNEIDGKPVRKIGKSYIVEPFKNNKNITKITIPESVREIGSNAFENCTNLVDITIETENCKIGNYAFYQGQIENTISVTMPITLDADLGLINKFISASYLSIKLHLTPGSTGKCREKTPEWFNDMYGERSVITELILDEGIVSLYDWYFCYQRNLKEVKLPSTLESIGAGAFDGCSGLTEIILPDSLKSIGDFAFLNTNIEHFKLPENCEVGMRSLLTYTEDGLIECAVPEDYFYYQHASKGLKKLLDDSYLFINQKKLPDVSYPISNPSMSDKTVVISENVDKDTDFQRAFDENGSNPSSNYLNNFIVFNKNLNNSIPTNKKIYRFDNYEQTYYGAYVDYYVSTLGYTREQVVRLMNGYEVDDDVDMEKTFGDDVITLPASDDYTHLLKEVYLNGNGGEFEDGSTEEYIVYLSNEEFSTPKQPKRYGYNFLGYTFAPDRTDIIEETFAVNHNYHLYANWELKDASVVVNYVDDEGNSLAESETITGKVFDKYETEEKSFTGYDLIEVPSNAKGEMTEDVITVNYVYKLKDTTVKVNYVDADTETELTDAVVLEGKYNKSYTTEAKSFYGYQLIETPEGASGTFSLSPITVTYRYQKKDATVTVKYLCAGEEISGTDTITGKVFDEYKTFKKDIEGYTLIKTPDNAEGIMKEDEILVIYEYNHVSEFDTVEDEGTPTDPVEPDKPQPKKKQSSPINKSQSVVNTGDKLVFLPIALALILAIGIAVIVIYMKTRKKRSVKP